MRLFFAFFVLLFIILFLHQTTTFGQGSFRYICCLSSCSYIKPQLWPFSLASRVVVYHLVPTSNHNTKHAVKRLRHVVYHLVPTSNHNVIEVLDVELVVVYHLVPTSNHNLFPSVITILQLFIILFLHQTTTVMVALMSAICCLSSCSYIKPQLCGFSSHSLCCCLSSCSYIKPQHLVKAHFGISVVYHLVPTSNHNCGRSA